MTAAKGEGCAEERTRNGEAKCIGVFGAKTCDNCGFAGSGGTRYHNWAVLLKFSGRQCLCGYLRWLAANRMGIGELLIT